MELQHVTVPVESRTIFTLWSDAGDVSFALPDLERGPILVPSLGDILLEKAEYDAYGS